jgi:hypothetical protein
MIVGLVLFFFSSVWCNDLDPIQESALSIVVAALGISPAPLCSNATTSIVRCANGNVLHIRALALKLQGSLVSDIGLLSRLTSLNVAQNALVGSLPRQLLRLSALEELIVSSNQFTGAVPELPPTLGECKLADNCFDSCSSITPWFCSCTIRSDCPPPTTSTSTSTSTSTASVSTTRETTSVTTLSAPAPATTVDRPTPFEDAALIAGLFVAALIAILLISAAVSFGMQRLRARRAGISA